MVYDKQASTLFQKTYLKKPKTSKPPHPDSPPGARDTKRAKTGMDFLAPASTSGSTTPSPPPSLTSPPPPSSPLKKKLTVFNSYVDLYEKYPNALMRSVIMIVGMSGAGKTMAAAATMVAAAEQHEQFKVALVKPHKELVVPAQKQGLDFNSSAESLRDELKQVSGFDDKDMVLPLAALACVLDDIDTDRLQVFPVGNLNDTAPGEMLHAMTADGPAFIFNEDMDIALSAIGWLRNQEAVQAVADGEHNSQTFLFHIHRNSNVHYTREDGEIVNAWDQFKTTVVYVA